MENSNTFADLGISPQLVSHLEGLGLTTPTPIQVQTIPQLMKMDGDFIGLAPTGTGKTAAFGLPLVENLDPADKATQALVLCPTRELALQVSAQLQNFGQPKGLRTVTIYGGASYRPQMEGVRRGAHIIIATPGRLVDMLDQKVVKLGHVKTIILDEADEMVSMGFKDDLERIIKETQSEGKSPRTWLFSATMSPGVRKIAEGYLKATGSVEVKGAERLSGTIEQMFLPIFQKDKAEALIRVLQAQEDFYGLIFCQTKMEAADVARYLTTKGYPAEAIHGDKTQADRERTLGLFKQKKVKALVATDVAARGLDIKDLTHVINLSLPWDVDTYVHRIGRTGRAGKQGVALSFISPNDVRGLFRLQSALKVHIKKMEIPSARKMAEQRLLKLQESLVAAMENEKLITRAQEFVGTLGFEGPLMEKTGLEVLAAFVATQFKDLLFQREIETFSTETKPRGFSRGSGHRRDESETKREYGPRRSGARIAHAPARHSPSRTSSAARRVHRTDEESTSSTSSPHRKKTFHREDRAPRAEHPGVHRKPARKFRKDSSEKSRSHRD